MCVLWITVCTLCLCVSVKPIRNESMHLYNTVEGITCHNDIINDLHI